MDKALSADTGIESPEAAPEKGAVEQETLSFEQSLIQMAREEGMLPKAEAAEPPAKESQSAEEQPEAEPEAKPGEKPETEPNTEETEEEEETEAEEQKPAAEEKLVPLRDVLDERAKKRRANERADRAEAEIAKREDRIAELERTVQQQLAPTPTPENPLIDIQDEASLARLEKSYKQIVEIDRDKVNDDGMIPIVTGKGEDGRPQYQEFSPEQVRILQARAEWAINQDIPKRRAYLAKRQQVDADAAAWYPDLSDPNHDFTKGVNQLTEQVLSGRAMSDPEVKFWAANALYGYLRRKAESEAKEGANGKSTKEDAVRKLAEASKTKLAPTAPRTRTIVERKSGAELAKAEENFLKNKNTTHSEEAALDYINALRSQKGQVKRVEPVAG